MPPELCESLSQTLQSLTLRELGELEDALCYLDHPASDIVAGVKSRRRLRGLYLAPPHGEFIAIGEKSAIAKPRYEAGSRKYDLEGEWILVSGDKAWGTLTIEPPSQVNMAEFDTLFNDHRISEKERLGWWPLRKTLWLYGIKEFQPYASPRQVSRPAGVQTVMPEVVFDAGVDTGNGPTTPESLMKGVLAEWPGLEPFVMAEAVKGGPGSGHRGHAGRPGERGGSVPSGLSPTMDVEIREALGPRWQSFDGDVYRGPSKFRGDAERRFPNVYGAGKYYSLTEEGARAFTDEPRKHRVYVDNPLRLTSKERDLAFRDFVKRDTGVKTAYPWPSTERAERAMTAWLKANGYDGIVVDYDGAPGGRQVVDISDISVPIGVDVKEGLSSSGFLRIRIVSGTQAEKGFSNRDAISPTEGLLISLPPSTGLWMKDTHIALKAAFLDTAYNVLEIVTLTPRDETVHLGPEGTAWALEASPDWFDGVGVEVGDRIIGRAVKSTVEDAVSERTRTRPKLGQDEQPDA